MQGRLKSLHSVWKKMQRKNSSLAEVYDARALRIVVDDEGGSRQQVGLAPQSPIPTRFAPLIGLYCQKKVEIG